MRTEADRLRALVKCSAVALLIPLAIAPSASAATSPEAAVNYLNQYRAENGLPAVQYHPGWISNCENTTGGGTFWAQGGGDSWPQAIPNVDYPQSLAVLLSPALSEIDISAEGTGCFTGVSSAPRPSSITPYSYPGNGYNAFYTKQGANADGAMIAVGSDSPYLLAYLFTPEAQTTASIQSASITDPNHNQSVLQSTPGSLAGTPFAYLRSGQPFQSCTTYTVQVNWELSDGNSYSQSFSFTTGQATYTDGEAVGEETDPQWQQQPPICSEQPTTTTMRLRHPSLHLKEADKNSEWVLLRLTASRALVERTARLFVVRQQRKCTRRYVPAAGQSFTSCTWRKTGEDDGQRLRLRCSQIIRVRTPDSQQRVIVTVKTRQFKNDKYRFTGARAKAIVR